MRISTRNDLVQAAICIAQGTLQPSELEFSEYIIDTIKIKSDEWDDAFSLDYKTSRFILAVQKDVIGIYNSIFNEKVSLKNIDNYSFLIVKFIIKDGCLNISSKIHSSIIKNAILKCAMEFFKDMTPKEKIASLLIIFATVGVFCASDIIKDIKATPSLNDLLIGNNPIAQKIANNQETPKILIQNIGNGTVEYNGNVYTKEEYKKTILTKKMDNEIVPTNIDDVFFIQQYNFKEQKAFIFYINHDPFWASTEWLGEKEREILKKICSDAISTKSVASVFLNLSCKILNGKIKEAIIQGLEHQKRPNADSYLDAILTTQNHSTQEIPIQASLLEP